MGDVKALTTGEVGRLVVDWFRLLTSKAPVERLLSLLCAEDLEMRFPEAVLRSAVEFEGWYRDVTGRFFDQVHEVKLLAIDLAGSEADVTLVVNWQARTWTAPAANSTWQGADVDQRWRVRRGRQGGQPVIARYEVGHFEPQQGPR